MLEKKKNHEGLYIEKNIACSLTLQTKQFHTDW